MPISHGWLVECCKQKEAKGNKTGVYWNPIAFLYVLYNTVEVTIC